MFIYIRKLCAEIYFKIKHLEKSEKDGLKIEDKFI